VAGRCEIGSRLLLIIDRKSHTSFQMRYKLSTLDDFEVQYCNISCSAFSLATAGFLICFIWLYQPIFEVGRFSESFTGTLRDTRQ